MCYVKRKENILLTLERKAYSIKTLIVEMNKHLLFRSQTKRVGSRCVSVGSSFFLVFKMWYCQRVGNGLDQASDRAKKGFLNASKFYSFYDRLDDQVSKSLLRTKCYSTSAHVSNN